MIGTKIADWLITRLRPAKSAVETYGGFWKLAKQSTKDLVVGQYWKSRGYGIKRPGAAWSGIIKIRMTKSETVQM